MSAILGLTKVELNNLMQTNAIPAYRGVQISDWIYKKGITNFEQMTNLPEDLRAILRSKYTIGRSKILTEKTSKDGTFKLLLELDDGERIETVGLPFRDRFSCCVSTQAGCPVGCIFCSTGTSGFRRNLSAGEIVDQILEISDVVKDEHKLQKSNAKITNVVFMGMGEPLLNYDNMIKAVRLVNLELGIGARHLTLSTIGIVPGIKRLAEEELQVTLAVSLHAGTEKVRKAVVPGVKWSLAEIIDTCKSYISYTNRRVTFEYCLLRGLNDSDEQAREFARLIRKMNCHVNIIPHNNVLSLAFLPPLRSRVNAFEQILKDAGLNVTVRVQRGADIDAACGQLRANLK